MPGHSSRLVRPEARSFTGLLVYMHQVSTLLLDLVFPPRCAGCGRADAAWCERCAADLASIPLRISVRRPAVENTAGMTLAATGIHQGRLQDAVHALKYDQVIELAPVLAGRLNDSLDRLRWLPEVIVPVPLHHNRQAERGYNQAYLLAEQIAQARGLPCLPNAVHRERYTRPQVGLNRDERRLNVMNAFTGDSTQISGKIVLMIDDVLTTGATLGSCGEALMAAGAKGVYGLTVTVARG